MTPKALDEFYRKAGGSLSGRKVHLNLGSVPGASPGAFPPNLKVGGRDVMIY